MRQSLKSIAYPFLLSIILQLIISTIGETVAVSVDTNSVEVRIEDYPSVVVIVAATTTHNCDGTPVDPPRELRNASHKCGGTIITRRHVLTAAHCVVEGFSKFWLFLCDYNFYHIIPGHATLVDNNRFQKYGVLSIAVHKDWQGNFDIDSGGDLAVLSLDGLIPETAQQKRVDIIDAPVPPGTIATALGWGRKNPRIRDKSTELQKIIVNITSHDECKRLYSHVGSDELCGISQNNISLCSGHSGGPLYNSDGLLIGVISRTIACNVSEPAFFVNLYQYRFWISKIVFEERTNETATDIPFLEDI